MRVKSKAQAPGRLSTMACTAALMVGGCDEEFAVDEVEVRASSSTGTVSTCGTWRCGFNAAEVNGRSLQSVRLSGEGSSADARVVGFVPPPGVLLAGAVLVVEGDEFVAKVGNKRYTRQALVGGIVLVRIGSDLPIPVTIAATELVESWAAGGAPAVAYTLVYPEPSAALGVKNVCSGSLLDPLTSATTVLGGETYDGVSKTVNAGMTGWFTLACAGSAAAKTKLLGYGPQSVLPGTNGPASVAARQATLKMITADYCGGGQSYTKTGTPVVWQNHEGTVDSSNYHAPGAVEAVWNEHGAVCLEGTRIAGTTAKCSLPSCNGVALTDGMWITHVALPE